MEKLKWYGWYDGEPISQGNVVLSYWNHIVNTYPSEGKDQNDLKRYTKEHYVQSCKRHMEAHTFNNPNKKFIIDLPVSEVYYDGTVIADDGYEENIPIWKTLDWIEYVVKELENDDRIIAWYHADEPEVWGYREVVNGNVTNANPKIKYGFLKDRYDLLKRVSKKPVLAVFCDVPLFLDNYYHKIVNNGPFFDIFGFDYYPFTPKNKKVDPDRIKKFLNISANINQSMQVLYVGQGSGSTEFNTITPTLLMHEELFKTFIRLCPEERRFGYLLWSYQWADAFAKVTGDIVLIPQNIKRWIDDVDIEEKNKPNLKKNILNKVKSLLSLLRVKQTP